MTAEFCQRCWEDAAAKFGCDEMTIIAIALEQERTAYGGNLFDAFGQVWRMFFPNPLTLAEERLRMGRSRPHNHH